MVLILKKDIAPKRYSITNNLNIKIFDLVRIFNKQSRKKIKVKWLSNRKIKYKVDQYLRKEAKKKAHYDRYGNESREELMARLEMKDRERARILKMEKDKREVAQILQITKL